MPPLGDGSKGRKELQDLDERQTMILADIFRALACESHVRIFGLIQRNGEINVSDLVRELGQQGYPMLQPTVSNALDVMKEVGLVKSRKEGKYNFWSVDSAALHTIAENQFVTSLQCYGLQIMKREGDPPVIDHESGV